MKSPKIEDLEVNVPQVLGRLRLDGEIIQQEFVTQCMFHHETSSPNLEINSKTGLWHCWVCGERGNLPRLVMVLQGTTYKDAIELISEFSNALDIVTLRTHNLAQLTTILQPQEHRLKAVDIARYRKGRSWWWYNSIPHGRFDRETVGRFCLGYDGVSKRGIIPVRAEGKWVGTIGRAVNDQQRPRYKYSKGFDRRHVLYGLPYIAARDDSCVVVEGAKDALRAYSYGFGNFVATLGTGLTHEQVLLIEERFDEVTIFSDNDAAGHLAQFKMCQQLAERIPRVFVVQWHTNRKDPNELSATTMRRMLDQRIHWTALVEPDYDPAGMVSSNTRFSWNSVDSVRSRTRA